MHAARRRRRRRGREGQVGGRGQEELAGPNKDHGQGRLGSASINTGGNVVVSKGKLTDVTLTAVEAGTAVEGTMSGDGKAWKPNDQLERATKYKITAKAKDEGGRKAVENSTFTTVSPDNSFIGTYTREDGQNVGVGMPVSISFDKAISDKKAVQSAIKVDSTSGQKAVGHWFDDTRLDFRPQEYWKAGSKVTLNLNARRCEGRPGRHGRPEQEGHLQHRALAGQHRRRQEPQDDGRARRQEAQDHPDLGGQRRRTPRTTARW